jgi:alanine-synthesizing transaminase
MSTDFHRIRRLPPYVFAHIDPIKAKLRAEGVDIIDLGMGNPDMPTPEHIVSKLQETVKDGRTHRYSTSRGIPGLRKAQASYYGRRFGVKLNPDTQVVATLGSKEGFANMASAITAPGDVVLVPNPTYPIHSFGFIMSGGVVRSMPADPNEDFMRSLDRAVRHSIPKPIALVLNYPANPTAYTADLDFYAEVVKYCKANDIFILSDLAYSEIYFDEDAPPPSVLQVPGAIDITVEFTSMSKTYSMPGWRVGFAVGNERLIAALARVKSYLDYGAFTPIQVAAVAALNGSDDVIEDVRKVYKQRRDVMVESFGRAGWDIPVPKATMFAWAPIPAEYAHMGSLEFAKLLIQETGVGVAPGVGFGEYGDQYIRLAFVENEHRIRQAARNIKKFLGGKATQGNVVPLANATK